MSRAARATLLALTVALQGCPNAWRFEHVEGAPETIDTHVLGDYVCTKTAFASATGVWATTPKLHLHCAYATDADRALCEKAPGHRGPNDVAPDLTSAKSLLSFVHLSDAQIKERGVKLTGPYGDAASYDGIISAAGRDDRLERFGDASYLSAILAVNELADDGARAQLDAAKTDTSFRYPMKPRFVIHTGDTMDSGMFSELAQYLGVMNQLDLPYFDAVGNHDNRFFGTFRADDIRGFNVVLPYTPIGTTDRFMRFHSNRGAKQDTSLPVLASQQTLGDHGPTEGIWLEGRKTYFHGFDLACPTGAEGLCPLARGYYAFTMEGEEGSVFRMIVLNTSEILPESATESFFHGAQGHVLPAQIDWLRNELLGNGIRDPRQRDDAYFVVFGHHNLSAFMGDAGEQIEQLFLDQPRLLAYITGHTHVNSVVEHVRPGRASLWEIIGGAMLVYPQVGRVLEFVRNGEGSVFLRSQTFRQQIGDLASLEGGDPDHSVDVATRAELERTCAFRADGCEPPPGGYCLALAERAHLARLGAAQDDDADRRSERDAVEAMNGVMEVYRGAR
ncbi:MAG: metallophosphoesterase [Polyangiaceae bacterium]